MPVESGVKYAANFWTHLRDFQARVGIRVRALRDFQARVGIGLEPLPYPTLPAPPPLTPTPTPDHGLPGRLEVDVDAGAAAGEAAPRLG